MRRKADGVGREQITRAREVECGKAMRKQTKRKISTEAGRMY
jgi:hypothetical protein